MFDPSQELASQIVSIPNAWIIPRGEGRPQGIARRAGIYRSDGSYVEVGQCTRNSVLPTTCQPVRTPAAPTQRLEGTWAFGGLLYNHFGHSLLESTGRLWVTDHVPGIEGFLFLLKKENVAASRFVRPALPMLRMIGGENYEYLGVNAPFEVENLVVAPQAFGTGDMITGSPEMRAHLRGHLGRKIAPDGPDKIYISRRKLFSKRGRYFAEARIEALLEAEGYTIFHPQEASLEVQAAYYAAAKKIISSDSSALHFAAMLVRPDCRLAIVLRRPSGVLQDYLRQFEWIAGISPEVINALSGQYFTTDADRVKLNEVYSVLDLPALGAALENSGYISSAAPWTATSPEDLAEEVTSFSARLGAELVDVDRA